MSATDAGLRIRPVFSRATDEEAARFARAIIDRIRQLIAKQ